MRFFTVVRCGFCAQFTACCAHGTSAPGWKAHASRRGQRYQRDDFRRSRKKHASLVVESPCIRETVVAAGKTAGLQARGVQPGETKRGKARQDEAGREREGVGQSFLFSFSLSFLLFRFFFFLLLRFHTTLTETRVQIMEARGEWRQE